MSALAQAYDFERFETRQPKPVEAVAVKQPKKQPLKKAKVTVIPQAMLEKNRRAKIKPLKMISWIVCFATIFGLMFSMVKGQAVLTELTNEVNIESVNLEEAYSKEVYLKSRAVQRYDPMEIEAYATNQLGMGRMKESQVVYINLAQEDRGTVIQETETSGFSAFLHEVKSWFA